VNEFARHGTSHRLAGQHDGDRAGARTDAAPREPGGEDLPGVGQPAGERPLGDLQPECGLRPRQSFEVAQDDRGAVLVRQFGQLLVDHAAEFAGVVGGVGGDRFGGSGHGMLQRPPSGDAGLQGGAVGDGVQPAAD
jgi:hypothetical protein